jgi:hypothetical protein
MEFSRRLVTFLATIIALVGPVVAELNMTDVQILTVFAIGALTIFGYNGEDWIKATKLVRRFADFADDLADVMEAVDSRKLPPSDKVE